MIVSKQSHGIKISVEPKFDGDILDEGMLKYIFTYTITLENTLPHEVQLLRRRWNIFDSCGRHHIVEGEGVIGQQPVLKQGDTFEYSSWCPLTSTIGSMKGIYIMLNKDTQEEFEIEIPEFQLLAEWVNN